MIVLVTITLLAACSSSSIESPAATKFFSTKEPVNTSTRPPDLAISSSTPQYTEIPETTPTGGSTSEYGGVNISKPVITLNQTGGIAGINLTWELYSDGRIIDPDGNQVVVDQQQVTVLLDRISALGFFSLEQRKPSAVCCDFFTFTLSVSYEGVANTISYSEGDSAAPAIFLETIEEILLFLDQVIINRG